MKKLLLIGVSTVALLAAAPQTSQAQSGPMYVNAFGGFGWGAFGEVNSAAFDHDYNTYNSYNWDRVEEWWTRGTVGDGWLLGVAVGGHLSDHVRGELEGSHLRLGTDTAFEFSCDNISNGNCDNFDNANVVMHTKDHLSATFLMANLWYDFAPGSALDPYIGGGAGVAKVKGMFSAAFETNSENRYMNQVVDGWAPALQVGLGLGIMVSQNVFLDLGYRFKTALNLGVNSDDNDFETENNPGDISGWTASNKFSLGVHTVQLGVRLEF